MTIPAEGPPPSPELFFDTAFAHQRSAALKAAVEIDRFTAVAAGASNPGSRAS
jgi:hypothetical protein